MPKPGLILAAGAALLAMALLAMECAAARETAPLPPALTRAMAEANVPAANVSIHVRDAATGGILIDLNDTQPRSPASTIKVLTTFAALDSLGPAYTWKTRAYLGGRLANGVLSGDLILTGGGDPYMTSERWWAFVQRLREMGLAKINGDVVIDNSYFAPVAASRADFDSQPYRSYNVLPDALLVNFQTSQFTLIASPTRSRPFITVNPLPANLVLKNHVETGAGKCDGARRNVNFDAPDPKDATLLVVSGGLATSCDSYSISRAIMTAPEYAYGTFRTMWKQSGGAIDGALRIAPLPAAATLFYEHDSLPLPEIIRLVNKFSNNVMARHLLLTLGATRFGAPATAENGRNAVRLWLASRQIEIPGLVLDNGSGLSRSERVTVRGLADVLDLAWHSPYMPEFAASLPLSAMDGTLRSRFGAVGMQGRLRLKTGRIDDVSGLAGFVNAASGRTFVVTILMNHPGAQNGAADAIQGELVGWVFAQ